MALSSDKATVRGFVPPQNDAEHFLMRHIEDMARLAQKRGIARYSDFLSDREQSLAQAALNKVAGLEGCAHFEGGTPEAERKVLCIEPQGCYAAPPIACVKLVAKLVSGAKPPEHKDYLGSLMGLSFERACIGDIVLPQTALGEAYIFVLETVQPVVLRELTSIGRISVRAQEQSLCDLPVFSQTNRILQSATVSSLRLDAVLAAMLRCSRGMAADYITAQRVEINHVPVQSVHASVYEQDVFTVRGKGRFQLVHMQGKSKKNREIIEYFQF